MDTYDFEFQGIAYRAVNANWSDNGCQVWDIVTGEDVFVDSIFVPPTYTVDESVNAYLAGVHVLRYRTFLQNRAA